jgi:hypothetical protein
MKGKNGWQAIATVMPDPLPGPLIGRHIIDFEEHLSKTLSIKPTNNHPTQQGSHSCCRLFDITITKSRVIFKVTSATKSPIKHCQ